MPHIYIPEVFISQDEYDMIQDNQVPIDAFIANKVRNDEMFVYVQETDCKYKRAQNYEWSDELYARQVPNKKFENPDKWSTICDI
tara:strand:- start:77 stop:331 length:255 start_codon:yes stop_codon:yes gene_type:complete